jgi:hypothetical protein
VWQALHAELKAQNFTVITVAFDSRDGAAKPWIDEAQPEHPTLIDPFHHVADLYNMDNVNLAVWIDETGRMVRPVESAGVTEGFRRMNRSTGEVPEAVINHTQAVKTVYHDALRDWVNKGKDSEHVLDDDALRASLNLPTDDTAGAHAAFTLGQYLIASGNAAEGDALVARASELHPASWAIWRQGAELDDRGLAATADFWQRVDALGKAHYYAPVDMAGMPDGPGPGD